METKHQQQKEQQQEQEVTKQQKEQPNSVLLLSKFDELEHLTYLSTTFSQIKPALLMDLKIISHRKENRLTKNVKVVAPEFVDDKIRNYIFALVMATMNIDIDVTDVYRIYYKEIVSRCITVEQKVGEESVKIVSIKEMKIDGVQYPALQCYYCAKNARVSVISENGELEYACLMMSVIPELDNKELNRDLSMYQKGEEYITALDFFHFFSTIQNKIICNKDDKAEIDKADRDPNFIMSWFTFLLKNSDEEYKKNNKIFDETICQGKDYSLHVIRLSADRIYFYNILTIQSRTFILFYDKDKPFIQSWRSVKDVKSFIFIANNFLEMNFDLKIDVERNIRERDASCEQLELFSNGSVKKDECIGGYLLWLCDTCTTEDYDETGAKNLILRSHGITHNMKFTRRKYLDHDIVDFYTEIIKCKGGEKGYCKTIQFKNGDGNEHCEIKMELQKDNIISIKHPGYTKKVHVEVLKVGQLIKESHSGALGHNGTLRMAKLVACLTNNG
jgi:hypothetical protein